jgi:hypothetical protein
MSIPLVSSVSGGVQSLASEIYAMQFTYSSDGNGYSGDRGVPTPIPPTSFLLRVDYYKQLQKYYSQTLESRHIGDLAFVTLTRSISFSAISLDESLGQITEFLKLKDGWDGYGGYSPSASVCEYTHGVVMRLASEFPELPSPQISPTSNGTLTLSWKAPLGHACIEIGDENYSAYIRYHDHFIPMKGVCSKLGANELQLISACLFQ